MKNREHRSTPHPAQLDEQIRKQAYYLWQQDGCRDGHEIEHWLTAAEMVKHRHAETTCRLEHHRERRREHLAAAT